MLQETSISWKMFSKFFEKQTGSKLLLVVDKMWTTKHAHMTCQSALVN